MTNRTPVVLMSFPNCNYFYGTFDTVAFRQWWRSRPLPGNIESIKKGLHIYGRAHLAIAKLIDGTWAVYLSKNYGIDWELVFSTSEKIYDIVLIEFGWAIMNTSGGFYETTNAGRDWTLILGLPSAPVAPAFANVGGGSLSTPHILMCSDGRYIWRSTDAARHWTKVCDQRAIKRYIPDGLNSKTGGDRNSITYNGPTYPCIAGACGFVIAGFGPFMTYSYDNGDHWIENYHTWDDFVHHNDQWEWNYPPLNLVWYRFYSGDKPQFLIKQLLVTSVDGPNAYNVRFLLRYDDLQAVGADGKLYSRVFTTYPFYFGTDQYLGWRYEFQQYISPTNTEQISAYDVAVLGSVANERLTFSAQTRIDSSGNQIPSLKYSLDGDVWTDIDLNNIQIGTPEGLPLYGGQSFGDSFSQNVWIYSNCDNKGHWNYINGGKRQNQSQELDILVEKEKSKTFSLGAIVSKKSAETVQLDTILQGTGLEDFLLDQILEGQNTIKWRINTIIKGQASQEVSLDAILSASHIQNQELDAILQVGIKRFYRLGLLLGGKTPVTFQLDMMLERYRLNERLSRMENVTPQFLDLDVPFIPSTPYNSSLETL